MRTTAAKHSPDAGVNDTVAAIAAEWARIGLWLSVEAASEPVDVEASIARTARVAREDERLFGSTARVGDGRFDTQCARDGDRGSRDGCLQERFPYITSRGPGRLGSTADFARAQGLGQFNFLVTE